MRVRSLQDLPPALRADAERQLAAKRSAPVVEEAVAPKRSKYGSTRVEADGITFDSKWELQRYRELRNLEHAGLIVNLQVHQPFALSVQSPDGSLVRIASYIADFTYTRLGEFVVEDAKSPATRRKELYVLKRKMVEAEYNMMITEVERNRPRLGAA